MLFVVLCRVLMLHGACCVLRVVLIACDVYLMFVVMDYSLFVVVCCVLCFDV